MITQFSGCTLRRVVGLKEPQKGERRELHQHHAGEGPSKALRGERIGLAILAHRRSQARRAPSAINNPPVTRSSHALTLGRVSTAPILSTNQAYAASQMTPMVIWMP